MITLILAPSVPAATAPAANAQVTALRSGRGSNRGSLDRAITLTIAMMHAVANPGKAIELPVAMFATGATGPAYVAHNALKGKGTADLYAEYAFSVVALKGITRKGRTVTGQPDWNAREGLFLMVKTA